MGRGVRFGGAGRRAVAERDVGGAHSLIAESLPLEDSDNLADQVDRIRQLVYADKPTITSDVPT